jgi:hypothetical protein
VGAECANQWAAATLAAQPAQHAALFGPLAPCGVSSDAVAPVPVPAPVAAVVPSPPAEPVPPAAGAALPGAAGLAALATLAAAAMLV